MAIQDPAEMGMEKRLLLAMVLSMAILFLVPFLYRESAPLPPPELVVEAQEPAPPEVAQVEPERSPETAETPITFAVRQSIEVESDDLVLRWTNAGGVLQSAQLKGYESDGAFLEMIPQQLPESASQVFGLRVGDEELDRRLREAVYEVSGVSGETIRAPAEITLHYQDARIEVNRKIHVPETGYLVEMETDVRTEGRSIPFSILLGPGIGEIAPADQGDFAEPKASYYLGGSVERHTAGDIREEDIRLDAGTRWVGLESTFFSYLLLSPENIRGGSITQTEVLDPGDASATVSLLSIEVDLEGAASYAVFLGPKDYQVLQATDVTLSQLIDYGWFAFLVKPLLLSLNFIYRYLHNYGWAIIVLTFGINVVLFPLRYKQMASMKKMSELQPQMKAIQDRYKRMKRTDPRQGKKNEEVMALYKKHGVNPLGGCLPLVVQMPFLFSFFSMLRASIELRGAPFFGWIQDLSRHDPYYVTPILMGISMVVQQKMTPAAGDATQRKMMMVLPIVFTFFFLNFSSGLVLYFLFSNLFGMMFQFLTQRWQQAAEEAPTKKSAKKN